MVRIQGFRVCSLNAKPRLGTIIELNASPNDNQLNGERLQRELTYIIARFRLGKVALKFGSDIAKMYRQILTARFPTNSLVTKHMG